MEMSFISIKLIYTYCFRARKETNTRRDLYLKICPGLRMADAEISRPKLY